MPAPKVIADAERDTRRARSAAESLGAPVMHGLRTAEDILAEARFFAYATSESRCVTLTEDASRLLSAILGFEVEVTGVRYGLNQAEGYARLAR